MTAVAARRSSESTDIGRRPVLSTRPSSRPASQLVRPEFMRPSLRVIDQASLRSRARRRTTAIAAFVVLLAGFFAVALIQAQLVADQHELDVLRGRMMEAEAERARLSRDVEEASAPGAIIRRAQELGMVRATDPVYLSAVGPAPRVATPIALVPEAVPGSGVEVAAGAVIPASDNAGPLTVAAPLASSNHGNRGVVGGGTATTAASPALTAATVSTADGAVPVLTTVAGTRAVSEGLDAPSARPAGSSSG